MPKCCVSGHRPHRFPWNYRDSECKEHQKYLRTMAVSVKKLIDEGYDCFISGGAIGVDTDFAEAVLQAKADFAPWIALELALPCPGHDRYWRSLDKLRIRRLLSAADKITYVSDRYTFSCMQKRNEYMVDESDMLLAVWNGIEKGGTFNTIAYARKKGIGIEIIDLIPQNFRD